MVLMAIKRLAVVTAALTVVTIASCRKGDDGTGPVDSRIGLTVTAPIDASKIPQTGFPGTPVALSALATNVPRGVTFTWTDSISGQTIGSGASFSYSFSVGVHTICVKAQDMADPTRTALRCVKFEVVATAVTVIITEPGNAAKIAQTGFPGTAITLSALAGNVPGGVTYTWSDSLTGNPIGTGQSVSYSFSVGVHTICVKAQDMADPTRTALRCVKFEVVATAVSLSITAPSDSAKIAQTGFPGTAVTLSAVAGNVPGGVTFTWTDSISGQTIGSGASFSYSFSVGVHTICVKAQDMADPTRTALRCVKFEVVAPPPIDGRVFLAQPGADTPVENFRAYASLGVKGVLIDSSDVDQLGNYSLKNAPSILLDFLTITVREWGDTASWQFFPSFANVVKADYGKNQTFAVFRRNWLLTKGKFAGITILVSLEKAYTPSVPGASAFFERSRASADHPWGYRTLGFPSKPLPLVFDSSASNQILTIQGSVLFWQGIDSLEKAYGEDLFKPASASEASGPRVRIMIDTTLAAPAVGGPAIAPNVMDIVGGVFVAKSEALLTNPLTIQHELTHVMGFGHTCSWPSIMISGCNSNVTGVSAYDVAYKEFMGEAYELKKQGVLYGLGQAHQGERVFLLGLLEEPVAP